jgi:hypothetical protein
MFLQHFKIFVKSKEKQGSKWAITKARRCKGWKSHVNMIGND